MWTRMAEQYLLLARARCAPHDSALRWYVVIWAMRCDNAGETASYGPHLGDAVRSRSRNGFRSRQSVEDRPLRTGALELVEARVRRQLADGVEQATGGLALRSGCD